MDSNRARYLRVVYQRIVQALPGLSWRVKRRNVSSETAHEAGEYPEVLRRLSKWLKESRVLPLCFWIWLENSKGIANVAEFLATCPIFMFETALQEALQAIAYVYSSTWPNGDVNASLHLPHFTILLDSLFSSDSPAIHFNGEASAIWEDLKSIMSNPSPFIFPAENP